MPIQYNDDDPSINYREYRDKVKQNSIPDLFAYISRQSLYTGMDRPENMLGIQIEKVSSFFGNTSIQLNIKWKMKFKYWTTGGTRYLVSLEVVTQGISIAAMVPIHFEIINLDSDQTTTLTFDLAGNVTNTDRSVMLPNPFVQVNRNPPAIDFRVDRWSCRCWLPGENWCKHLGQFFTHEGDATEVRTVLKFQDDQVRAGRASSERSLKYPIAHGALTVDLTIESFLEKDILGEGDGIIHRMLAYEDVYLWISYGDSGMKIIRQIEELVKENPRYKFWHDAAFNLRFPVGQSKCMNSRHNMTDTRNFLNKCRETGGDHGKLEDLAFVNTYYEFFYGRCKSCVDFLTKMSEDTPQI